MADRFDDKKHDGYQANARANSKDSRVAELRQRSEKKNPNLLRQSSKYLAAHIVKGLAVAAFSLAAFYTILPVDVKASIKDAYNEAVQAQQFKAVGDVPKVTTAPLKPSQ